jgi:putative transcriptional regulator
MGMTQTDHTPPLPASLKGQLLIAMPGLKDPHFDHSVVYVCQHDEDSAMGLVLNHPLKGLSFPEMLDELGIDSGPGRQSVSLHHGGPVRADQGFVLHSLDYSLDDATLALIAPKDPGFTRGLGLTASRDILVDLARGQGPVSALITLGYAGWQAGQIEDEIRENAWLTAPARSDIVFECKPADMWHEALASLGISPIHLSSGFGKA